MILNLMSDCSWQWKAKWMDFKDTRVGFPDGAWGVPRLHLIFIITDKKENQIFLIYKEIQNGAVAKSYMTNGLLIHVWGNICAFPQILGRTSSYMTLQLLHSEFPYLWGKFYFLFYQWYGETWPRSSSSQTRDPETVLASNRTRASKVGGEHSRKVSSKHLFNSYLEHLHMSPEHGSPQCMLLHEHTWTHMNCTRM